ncbi:probable palmitoyltransferase ZDHHC24 [Drosophila takahashii]|uniref:probable palmitoyltransferase ZDHHC24 n=1 Tax=Drosophila takahashii TaxID=29030 RepID=UPI001CF8BE25|nr:probable palmitoyltransferase ZDHHC24 [Drosophila takahashii]
MVRFRGALRAACCWSRRMCFRVEEGILRFTEKHREKFVGLVHPFSALFLLGLIGFLTVYELYYVLPLITDPQGIWHKFNWLLGIYVVFNILGNWWLGFVRNTSVESLPAKRQHPAVGEAHLWHYCTTCQKLVPPRSWHCRLCNLCILKRDHHCTFTGNCIGHTNQRYFLGFLFHLTLGSGQALVYNALLTWENKAFMVSDPLLLLAQDHPQDAEFEWQYTVAAIFKLSLFLFMVPLGMFALQILMVQRNSTCYMILDRSYDVGWRRNFDLVLGKRRFWIFLSPTIKSPLPTDGTQWIQKYMV